MLRQVSKVDGAGRRWFFDINHILRWRSLVVLSVTLCSGCGVTNIKGNLVWQDSAGQSVSLTPDRCEGQNGWLDLSSTNSGARIHYRVDAWDGPEVQITPDSWTQTAQFRKANCSKLNVEAKQDEYSWQNCDGPRSAPTNCHPIGGDIHGTIDVDCSANSVRVKGRIDATNCAESKNDNTVLTPENLSRINTADVVHLQSHYEVPTVPSTLKGLSVLVIGQDSSDPSIKVIAATEPIIGKPCPEALASDFGQMGWRPVLGETEPHVLVARGSCVGGRFLSANGKLYILLATSKDKLRLETPQGKFVWEEDPPPATYQCPRADETTCAQALREYRLAATTAQIAHSPAVADFARLTNRD